MASRRCFGSGHNQDRGNYSPQENGFVHDSYEQQNGNDKYRDFVESERHSERTRQFGDSQRSRGMATGTPWTQANGYSTNGQGPTGEYRRSRREKFMPPKLHELELFNAERHIQAGELFDEQFGGQHDQEIAISAFEDDQPSRFDQRIQNFQECAFSKEIMKNITLRRYTRPTQIQKGIIPLIMRSRNDIMAHAQTGSGKTAAFLLPIINEIQKMKSITGIRTDNHYLAVNKDSPLCIIIGPTKELAEQLYEETRSFTAGTGVSVERTYGDMPIRRCLQEKNENGCDIYVACCGRLQQFIIEGHIKLGSIRYLVLDEGDKLIRDMHFYDCITRIKNHAEFNPECRIFAFSATFEESVQRMAEQILRQGFYFVRIGELNSAVLTVEQNFIEVRKYEKQNLLHELLKGFSKRHTKYNGEVAWDCPKTLVFLNEKRQTDRIAVGLRQEKFEAMSINADRTLKQRREAVDLFTRGDYQVLVCSDVTGRGINFPNVEHVINYDLPVRELQMYIHRIGRTGRAGNKGKATSFFDPTNSDDMDNAGYFVRNLREVNQPIPEFLLRYAGERLDSQRESLYEQGRERPDIQDEWADSWHGPGHSGASQHGSHFDLDDIARAERLRQDIHQQNGDDTWD